MSEITRYVSATAFDDNKGTPTVIVGQTTRPDGTRIVSLTLGDQYANLSQSEAYALGNRLVLASMGQLSNSADYSDAA